VTIEQKCIGQQANSNQLMFPRQLSLHLNCQCVRDNIVQYLTTVKQWWLSTMTIHDVVQKDVLTIYLIGDTSLDEGGEDEGGETRGVIAPLLAPL